MLRTFLSMIATAYIFLSPQACVNEKNSTIQEINKKPPTIDVSAKGLEKCGRKSFNVIFFIDNCISSFSQQKNLFIHVC